MHRRYLRHDRSHLALATITSRWRLEHLPGQQIRPALGATLRPSKLHLRATSRSANEQI